MSETILNNDNFEEEVTNCDIPVLIDFYADWCGPCLMLSPVIEEISDEFDGKVKVCKANVDENPELTAKFGIENIPAVFLIKNGEIVDSFVGYREQEAIEDFLSQEH